MAYRIGSHHEYQHEIELALLGHGVGRTQRGALKFGRRIAL